MLTKPFFFFIWFLLGAMSMAQARAHNFGLGIAFPAPTGITGKLWLDNTSAVDGLVGWNTGRRGNFHMHADYLIKHIEDPFSISHSDYFFYFGIGGRIVFHHNGKFGVRVPVGLNWFFFEQGELFFEIAPLLDLIPSTDMDINVDLGFRYYF